MLNKQFKQLIVIHDSSPPIYTSNFFTFFLLFCSNHTHLSNISYFFKENEKMREKNIFLHEKQLNSDENSHSNLFN